MKCVNFTLIALSMIVMAAAVSRNHRTLLSRSQTSSYRQTNLSQAFLQLLLATIPAIIRRISPLTSTMSISRSHQQKKYTYTAATEDGEERIEVPGDERDQKGHGR